MWKTVRPEYIDATKHLLHKCINLKWKTKKISLVISGQILYPKKIGRKGKVITEIEAKKQAGSNIWKENQTVANSDWHISTPRL